MIQSGFWLFFFCVFSVVDSVMAILYLIRDEAFVDPVFWFLFEAGQQKIKIKQILFFHSSVETCRWITICPTVPEEDTAGSKISADFQSMLLWLCASCRHLCKFAHVGCWHTHSQHGNLTVQRSIFHHVHATGLILLSVFLCVFILLCCAFYPCLKYVALWCKDQLYLWSVFDTHWRDQSFYVGKCYFQYCLIYLYACLNLKWISKLMTFTKKKEKEKLNVIFFCLKLC